MKNMSHIQSPGPMNHTTKANGEVAAMLPNISGNLHSSTQPYPTSKSNTLQAAKKA